MDTYEWIDHLKLNMPRSLGLNTSNVLIENVPLTVKSHAKKAGNGIPRVERIEEEEEEMVSILIKEYRCSSASE